MSKRPYIEVHKDDWIRAKRQYHNNNKPDPDWAVDFRKNFGITYCRESDRYSDDILIFFESGEAKTMFTLAVYSE